MSQKSGKNFFFFFKKMECVFTMHNTVSRTEFNIFQTDKLFPQFTPKMPKKIMKEINKYVTKINNNIIIC